jgi:hypothetical protein
MTQSLEADVLEDIEKCLSARGLKMSDCEITVIENLRSGGVIQAEGVRFSIVYKPSGKSAEYVEGHEHDIKETLCKDINLGLFP